MIEAVIFDVDGTLVDTVDMHAEACQKAFKEFDKDLEFQTVRDQIGKGGDTVEIRIELAPNANRTNGN